MGGTPRPAGDGRPAGGPRRLAEALRGRRAVVLSGAGCSTESGIPDYRGPESRDRPRRPILYQEFIRDPAVRARYWARSSVGWLRVARARPNPAHRALARLEEGGLVRGVITQNVDGLHQAAGSRRVVELHGSLARVRCLECGIGESRAGVQERILALNPGWEARLERAAPAGPDGDVEPAPDGAAELGAGDGTRAAPDGDAEVDGEAIRGFRVPACRRCGGVLKPDVVFFGENVPRARVEEAWRLFGEGELLLVVGSSLAVYSGYRFVRRAEEEGIPVAIVNLGETRGDGAAALRVDGRLGAVLPPVADALLDLTTRSA